MKKPIFTGCGVALITPFKNGSIDYDSLERLLFIHETKSDALILLGTTGEASALSVAERKEIIAFARRRIKNIPLIIGCGGLSTEICKEFCSIATKLDADGILAVTPFYNKSSREGILTHYREISKTSDLPIILYNVPNRTGLNLDLDTLCKLWEIPTVNGIKEATVDFSQVCATLAENRGINLWSGDDKFAFATSALGGKGVISVAANALPDAMKKLTKVSSDKLLESQSLHNTLFPLFKALSCEINPIPIKYLLSKLGFCKNILRLPLVPLSKAKQHLLDKVIEQLKKEDIL